ncbi:MULTISPECIES: beta family protein [Psychrobacter]|uniref:T4 beta protein n=1 Tax=Psychrobacter alimentarius TaxID=261164 RepID=A0ABN4N5I7_9GAMM|nr:MULTISPECIES: hypothetical protein [Psychrobacter]AMT98262.1 hypothetical protein A3K91_2695 [Psychrobacter alimentarius]QCB31953.1 hypothetical protein E5677_13675 [Psychrobacter sp. PAMC27889]
MILKDFVYVPALRTSVYNLGAVSMLNDSVKDLIIPRLIVTGKNEDCLNGFLVKWGKDRPFFLEVSKYALDLDCELNQLLNNSKQYFSEQYSFFSSKNQYQVIPLVNETDSTNLRDIMQHSLKLVNNFDKVAFRLDIRKDFQASLNLLTTLLSAFSDDLIQKVILIVDAGKISSLSDISTISLNQTLQFINQYKFPLVVFSSTSYPNSRPTSGTSDNFPCLDPIWQYTYINKLLANETKAIYGDFSATDPSTEKFDFDFAVRPIPYGTYLLEDSLEWYTLREGKGGEYDKFREVAKKIRSQNGYHGDTFCEANKIIKSIEDGTRNKAGNQAFWNKLKINEHISAIIDKYHKSLLDMTGQNSEDEDEDEDEDY